MKVDKSGLISAAISALLSKAVEIVVDKLRKKERAK